ncbi:MAG: peptidoglycan DD-metalloendopeptidase family protein [Pseudomonadota bacterium]
MVFAPRNRPSILKRGWLLSSAAVLALGFGLSACSADVSRFGSNSLGYGSDPEAQTQPIHSDGSLFDHRPEVSTNSGSSFGNSLPTTTGSVESTQLADAAPAVNEQRYEPAQYKPAIANQPSHSPAPASDGYRQANVSTPNQVSFGRDAPAADQPLAANPQATSITVQRGDTLYQLARRHRVSVEQLKQANGLSSNVIRPGQVLVVDGGQSRAPALANRVIERSRTSAPARQAIPSGETYTVRAGDSLYAISRRTGVRVAELQDLNNITDVRRIRPGTVLRLNSGSYAEPAATSRPADRRDRTTVQKDFVPRTVQTTTQPIIINSGQKQATAPKSNAPRLADRINDPAARPQAPTGRKYARLETQSTPSSSSGQKYRWPVSGRIIGRFGKQAGGKKNDGINIAVPVGTDIHAAEAGVVAYAGNELKGYGNLILIRHDNGFVTAYAHSSRMLVRRGDAVARGQVIAKAGKTGAVSRPQLHFELRDGAKPVDPMPHLGRL